MAADAEYLRMENMRLQERVQQLELMLSRMMQGGGQPTAAHSHAHTQMDTSYRQPQPAYYGYHGR